MWDKAVTHASGETDFAIIYIYLFELFYHAILFFLFAFVIYLELDKFALCV